MDIKLYQSEDFFARNVNKDYFWVEFLGSYLPIIPRETTPYEILYQIMCCHLTVYFLRYVWTLWNYSSGIKWTLFKIWPFFLWCFQVRQRRQQKVNSKKAIQDPDCSSLNLDFCFARKPQQLNCIQRRKGNKCRIDQKLLLLIWVFGRKHQLRCNSRYVNL